MVPVVRERLQEVLQTAAAVNSELEEIFTGAPSQSWPSNRFKGWHHQDPFLMREFSSHIPLLKERITRAALSTLPQTGTVYNGRENSIPWTRKHPLEPQGSGSQ